MYKNKVWESVSVVEKHPEKYNWKDMIPSSIYTILITFQIILFFFFYYNYYGLDLLAYLGWFIWILSIIFGFVPMYTFRKKGAVIKGKSYIHTTKLVDSGIYSIVRHPQYLAGILLNIALMLLTQHWLSIITGIIAVIIMYYDALRADSRLINKFGEDYKKYIAKVPRLNFLLGILRRIKTDVGTFVL
jgi:protein-S-isoprenylcysteine O-methyltransferase Ste14